ncbi:MAG: arsenosugar biosynthesis radical SAM protein ArsS [bacterium]|nr:arsenosugar biosynthesis radical SAM protein ArsS [bacterium]
MTPDFDTLLATHGLGPLRRDAVGTLQVNVGKVCNQACHHCHVDAGPTRTERMSADVAARVLHVLECSPAVAVLDLTGGAPELSDQFRGLVVGARRLGRRVIDRCNLTILEQPGQEDLAAFLAAERVDVVASLPCYGPDNVDAQRGRGVFARSIAALRRLNALGYGRPGTGLRLDLVYNPLGPRLPPPQAALEADYRRELGTRFGIVFDRLLTLTNMPIARFAADLARRGEAAAYLGLLVNHFNPQAIGGLMCRSLVSVAWDGRLHDCDFNQMLSLPLGAPAARTIWDVDDLAALAGAPIATAAHCVGCTAGAGSSCGGALA